MKQVVKHSVKTVLLSVGLLCVVTSVQAGGNSAPATPGTVLATEANQAYLRCQTVRCKNRQHRRIFRAQCRLMGGTPSLIGKKCTLPAQGH